MFRLPGGILGEPVQKAGELGQHGGELRQPVRGDRDFGPSQLSCLEDVRCLIFKVSLDFRHPAAKFSQWPEPVFGRKLADRLYHFVECSVRVILIGVRENTGCEIQ
jgi:hypothetical protein